jgi:hypothetical protein
VALSRVKSPKGLKILINEEDLEFKAYTENIVYHEIYNQLPKVSIKQSYFNHYACCNNRITIAHTNAHRYHTSLYNCTSV